MAGRREKRFALFTQAGYTAVETCRDYGGNDRLTLGQWS
jgi:release factor glutamine methyltransferase